MLLHKEATSISDSSALRTAALALTYYDMENHPEKSSVDWASSLANITEALTPSSGIIKTSIDEAIAIVEDKISVTVDSHMAYCQYYIKNTTEITENNITYTAPIDGEPGIHWDWETGFDPVYKPDHVAMVYIGPGKDSILEFWAHDGGLWYENEIKSSETLTTNDLIIFDHTFAHRMAPSSWGTTQSDSGLHLVLFMKTS
jgi:hypothetical protein